MNELSLEHDSSGQPYIAVPQPNGHVRLTYLPEDVGRIGSPSIRIQIVDQDEGHPRQGPEFPADLVDPMCEAALKLNRLKPALQE